MTNAIREALAEALDAMEAVNEARNSPGNWYKQLWRAIDAGHAALASLEQASTPSVEAVPGHKGVQYVIRRLQADIDDGSRPDQWSMEDMIRQLRATHPPIPAPESVEPLAATQTPDSASVGSQDPGLRTSDVAAPESAKGAEQAAETLTDAIRKVIADHLRVKNKWRHNASDSWINGADHSSQNLIEGIEPLLASPPTQEAAETLKRAAGQASFCLRTFLPNDPDAQMTVRMLEAALASLPTEQAAETPKPEKYFLLVLPPQPGPVYIVLRGENYGNDEDQSRYYYESYSCPTNWLNNERIAMIASDGDCDPHGLLKFVRSEPVPPALGVDWDDENQHLIARFPEVASPPTQDDKANAEGTQP